MVELGAPLDLSMFGTTFSTPSLARKLSYPDAFDMFYDVMHAARKKKKNMPEVVGKF